MSILVIIVGLAGVIGGLWLLWQVFREPGPVRATLGDTPFETVLPEQIGNFRRETMELLDRLSARQLGDLSSDPITYPGSGVRAVYSDGNHRVQVVTFRGTAIGIGGWGTAADIGWRLDAASSSGLFNAVPGTIYSRFLPSGTSRITYQAERPIQDEGIYKTAWDTGRGRDGWFFEISATSPEARDEIYRRLQETIGGV